MKRSTHEIAQESLPTESALVTTDATGSTDSYTQMMLLVTLGIIALYAVYRILRDLYEICFPRRKYNLSDINMAMRDKVPVRVNIYGDAPELAFPSFAPSLERMYTASEVPPTLIGQASMTALDIPLPEKRNKRVKRARHAPRRSTSIKQANSSYWNVAREVVGKREVSERSIEPVVNVSVRRRSMMVKTALDRQKKSKQAQSGSWWKVARAAFLRKQKAKQSPLTSPRTAPSKTKSAKLSHKVAQPSWWAVAKDELVGYRQ